MYALLGLKEDLVLFLSFPGSDKNRKTNFESQIKREMVICTLLPSLLQLHLLVEIISYSRRVKIGQQPDEPIQSKQEVHHFTTIM